MLSLCILPVAQQNTLSEFFSSSLQQKANQRSIPQLTRHYSITQCSHIILTVHAEYHGEKYRFAPWNKTSDSSCLVVLQKNEFCHNFQVTAYNCLLASRNLVPIQDHVTLRHSFVVTGFFTGLLENRAIHPTIKLILDTYDAITYQGINRIQLHSYF